MRNFKESLSQSFRFLSLIVFVHIGFPMAIAEASSSSSTANTVVYDVQRLRQDLNINDAQFTNAITALSARQYLGRLGFFLDSGRQERVSLAQQQEFVAQLKSDLQKFQADGSTTAQLITLFTEGIPYESWEAFKAVGGTLPQFMAAITGNNQDVRKAALLGLLAPGTESGLKSAYFKIVKKIHPDKHVDGSKLYYDMRHAFINGIYHDRPVEFRPEPAPAGASASNVSNAAFTLDPAEETAAAAWVPLDESVRMLANHLVLMTYSLRRNPTSNEMVNYIFETMAKPTDQGYSDLPEYKRLTKSQIVKILRDIMMVIE